MNKKTIKYLLGLALLLFLGYNSIYFRKLDEVKAEKEGHRFDAAKFAEKFWQNDLPPALATAVDIKALLPMLANDPTWASVMP